MTEIKGELSTRLANMRIVCALLVVAIHTEPVAIPKDWLWPFKYVLYHGVAVIGVPFFFFASGLFLGVQCKEEGWWLRACRKRIKTLLVPFVFWCTVVVVIGKVLVPLVASVVNGARFSPDGSEIIKWGTYGLDLFSGPILGPLWFVRTLFIFVLLGPFLKFCLQKSAVVTLMVVGLAYYIMDPVHDQIRYIGIGREWWSFWGWYFSLEGLFYFLAGLCVSINEKARVLEFRRPWLAVIGIVVCVIPLLFDVPRLRVAPLAIPFVLAGVWSLCPAKRAFGFCGYAFPIYVLHGLVKKGLILLPSDWQAFTGWFAIEWFVMVSFSLLLAFVIRILSEPLFAFAFGNRR